MVALTQSGHIAASCTETLRKRLPQVFCSQLGNHDVRCLQKRHDKRANDYIWRCPKIQNGGTPSYHPFVIGLSILNHPAIGYTHDYGNPPWLTTKRINLLGMGRFQSQLRAPHPASRCDLCWSVVSCSIDGISNLRTIAAMSRCFF